MCIEMTCVCVSPLLLWMCPVYDIMLLDVCGGTRYDKCASGTLSNGHLGQRVLPRQVHFHSMYLLVLCVEGMWGVVH